MATITDISAPPLSGLNYIDALLDEGPAWNYIMPGSSNTISYTFSVASGNQSGNTSLQSAVSAFSAVQQAGARTAMAT